jgi:uncharacterized repeat protein (TIGR01451 family)
MAKIKKKTIYTLQNPINPNDYFIGTDVLTGKTKNFTLGEIMSQDYNLDALEPRCLSFVRRTATDSEGNVTEVPLQPLDVFQAIIDKVCNVVAIPVFDLTTIKSVSNSTPIIGETFIYTITIQNKGNINATGVLLSDLIPSGLTFVSANTAAYNPTNGLWTLGNIDAGSTATLNISVSLDAGANLGSIITNTITSVVSDQSDTSSAGDNLSVDVTVSDSQVLKIDAGYNRYLSIQDTETNLKAISQNSNVTYLWEVLSGSATISNPNQKETLVTNISSLDTEFKITMTDLANNNIAVDTVKHLKRANSVSDNPVVSLADQTTASSTVVINGAYTDPQSLPNPQFQWTFEETGSTGTTYSFVNENIQNVTINNLSTGTYFFRLTVTNTNGFIGEDAAIIIIT